MESVRGKKTNKKLSVRQRLPEYEQIELNRKCWMFSRNKTERSKYLGVLRPVNQSGYTRAIDRKKERRKKERKKYNHSRETKFRLKTLVYKWRFFTSLIHKYERTPVADWCGPLFNNRNTNNDTKQNSFSHCAFHHRTLFQLFAFARWNGGKTKHLVSTRTSWSWKFIIPLTQFLIAEPMRGRQVSRKRRTGCTGRSDLRAW